MASHNEDKNNWREKYLNALDIQESLEKDFAQQQELLRKTLVRVSVAADGQNAELDQMLSQLRERLRTMGATMNVQDMDGLLARLEKAVIGFEDQRTLGAREVRESLTATLKPLQQLDLSRSINKEISRYIDNLPARSQKIYLYPALLRQLADLQVRALEEVEKPKTSFLSRLLPGRSTNPQAENSLLESAMQEAAALKNIKTTLTNEKPFELEKSIEFEAATERKITTDNTEVTVKVLDDSGLLIVPADNSLPMDPAELHEAAQERRAKIDAIAPETADKITQVLIAFLNSLENESSIQSKVDDIRKKVDQGLPPDALIPTLEGVRDLVMEAYLAANDAFATYLKDVNQELVEIYSLIGGAVEHSQSERAASRQLQEDVMRHMDDLATQSHSATDISQLKHQVQSQLGNIRQAIDSYQHSDADQNQLAQQLATLSEKIKNMEAEAEKNRETLDTQRYKAMHDSLTDLPNREAYNQRIAIEIQRWQRYGRPLSLAIFDIDHFKKINDNYGHQAGDRVIKVIGKTIQKRLREVDFFCRYGGEEFVALMPETSGPAALLVLEKIREAIACASFNYKDQHLSITFSVGLTEFKQDDVLEAVFERADTGLYAAKEAGRNCCKLV